ncbi:D-isomer specific 2-hydroxyacid dehydrogenase family protein [Acidisphaera sp. L21]|uniref:D-isomer specific 2-hydroxyacid dehydrogenase family protein n=1 Tax=Acidisphaera sp. L21 TaxID=1641851 RepID=UPI0020B16AAF|nr:hypothetical protein [Acidisphaera sp. L21]
MSGHIVVLDPISERVFGRMTALLPPGFTLSHATGRDEAHLQAIIADAEYVITGQIAVPESLLRAAKRVKLLHKWGVGTDNIDVAAANALGIRVARTTGNNSVPVAEFTIALTLSTLRHLAWAHEELRLGHWRGGRLPGDAYILSGKTVGVVDSARSGGRRRGCSRGSAARCCTKRRGG